MWTCPSDEHIWSTRAGSPTSVWQFSICFCHEQDDLPQLLWDPYLNNLLGYYQSIFSSAYLSAWFPQFDHIAPCWGVFLRSFEQRDRNRTVFFSGLSGQYWGWCPTLSWCQDSVFCLWVKRPVFCEEQNISKTSNFFLWCSFSVQVSALYTVSGKKATVFFGITLTM